MELSILVARMISLIYLSVAVGILIGKLKLDEMVESFEKSPGLIYLSGIFTLIIGMLLVTYHNIWVKDWIVLVTIIGWLTLIKGVLLIVFPQYLSLFKSWYKNIRVWAVVIIILGLLFGYFGFIR